MKIVTSSRIG